MITPIYKLHKKDYPYLLQQISALPESMDMKGALPDDTHKFLCVVGSRHPSNYGREVCKKLIAGLRGHPVVIVSGLAYGIDSLAHEIALEVGLKTIAFPGSGLADHVIYPSTKRLLAHKIIEGGGAILSPFKLDQKGGDWTFPARNRLMAGISQATLIIEGRRKSGTLITARCAADFNRDLLIVPGSIFSELSDGPNWWLRNGGTAVTSAEDILESLGFEIVPNYTQTNLNFDEISLSPEERNILEFLRVQPLTSSNLIEKTSLPAHIFNIKVSELELRGLIHGRDGYYRIGSGN